MTDISIFDGEHPLLIDKPIRLIELFAGYGSQSLALKYLGVPFRHHCISEWAINSIQAYKDVHFGDDGNDYSYPFSDNEIRKWFHNGRISRDYNKPLTDEQIDKMPIATLRSIFNNMWASNNRGSICLMHAIDLNITEVQDYTYILTYSFPCQDLSMSGLRQGMARGGQTRSGMLWEVERLLFECEEESYLPQILLMENVPEVVGQKNMDAFSEWIESLDRLGYRSYWKILNATEFGVPQNRKRCFMVSVLGDYYFEFPEKMGCGIRLKHILEPNVDESYYLSDKLVETFVAWSNRNESKGNGFGFHPKSGMEEAGGRYSRRLAPEGMTTSLIWRNIMSVPDEPTLHQVGTIEGWGYENALEVNRRVYATDGLAPTQTCKGGGRQETKIMEELQTGRGEMSNEPNLHIKTNNSKGYEEAYPGDSVSIAYPTSGTRRGRVGHGQSQTLDTAGGELQGIVEEPKMFIYDAYNHTDITDKGSIGTLSTTTNHGSGNCGTFYVGDPHYRIRKLTEKECFRLMGVKDEDSALIASHQSKTSQYHLAGDSIVTSCLMAIFGEMCGVDWRKAVDELVNDVSRDSKEELTI